MMKKNNKKGFTLVELVIVIAVIAILAAVLIPTFAVVIGNANKSAALQEGESLQTGILAVYNKGTFDDYCEERKDDNNITVDSTIIKDATGDDAPKFKDYISKIDGEKKITIQNDTTNGWTISYTVGKYTVKITAKGVSVA